MKIGKKNPRLLCYMSAVALSVAGCSQHTTKTKPSPVSLTSDQAQPSHLTTPPQSQSRLFHYSKKGVRQVNVTDTNRTKRVQYEYGNLWERLFDSYSLPDVQNTSVEREVAWFVNHPTYLQRAQQRAEPFLYNIVQQIERQGVPGELALLPVVESAFQAQAVSPAKAAGIWQFIPATGRNYGLKQNHAYDGRRDVYASTKAAIKYLKKLNRQFDGDWLLSIAAYNCGEGAVERAIRRNAYQGLPTDFWSLDLPQETRAYVPRLLAVSRLFAGADRYGLDLRDIPNEAMFKTVKVSQQLDLAVAADAADMSLEAFRAVNPGFKHTFVDPDGSVRLFVPAHKSKTFKKELARLASVQGDLLRREFESRQARTTAESGIYASDSASVETGAVRRDDLNSSSSASEVSAMSVALKASTQRTVPAAPYSAPSASFSAERLDATPDPFEPAAFVDETVAEPRYAEPPAAGARRALPRAVGRSMSPVPRKTHHETRNKGHAQASEHASSPALRYRYSSPSNTPRHAGNNAGKSVVATGKSASTIEHRESARKLTKIASSNATAVSQKGGKNRGDRTSALASPQKTVIARNSDARKSNDKIVTAKADTTRLKSRR